MNKLPTKLTYPFQKGDSVDCTDLSNDQVQLTLNRMWELGARKHEGVESHFAPYVLLRWSSTSNCTIFNSGSIIKKRTITWQQIMEHEQIGNESESESESNGNTDNDQSHTDTSLSHHLNTIRELLTSHISIELTKDNITLHSDNISVTANDMSAEETKGVIEAMGVLNRYELTYKGGKA